MLCIHRRPDVSVAQYPNYIVLLICELNKIFNKKSYFPTNNEKMTTKLWPNVQTYVPHEAHMYKQNHFSLCLTQYRDAENMPTD